MSALQVNSQSSDTRQTRTLGKFITDRSTAGLQASDGNRIRPTRVTSSSPSLASRFRGTLTNRDY